MEIYLSCSAHELRLQNLQLHHEMVLSPLSKICMEYTRVRKVCLKRGTSIPSISTHGQLGLQTILSMQPCWIQHALKPTIVLQKNKQTNKPTKTNKNTTTKKKKRFCFLKCFYAAPPSLLHFIMLEINQIVISEWNITNLYNNKKWSILLVLLSTAMII